MTLHSELNQQTAVHISAAGGPEVLVPQQVAIPTCGPDDVLIEVAVAGVNRHDVNQRRRGPDAVHSPIPGLEVSGVIVVTGANVTGLRPGERVCALVNGGGYAQFVAAHQGQVLPVPAGMTMADAAALPEALFTLWHNFFDVAGLVEGECVLIHGGTSGVGSIAIQVLTAMGFTVYATCGTDEKCEIAERLGAKSAFNYRKGPFEQAVLAQTGNRGVDVILDMAGVEYGHQNVAALAPRGRIVHLSPGHGAELSIPLRDLMRKEGVVTGSLLRPLSDDEKGRIGARLLTMVWPLLGTRVRPLIAARYALADAHLAHACLEAGDVAGKILLDVVAADC
ncbi:NAD(P)H-quinone oxidoreductase [Cupriavidus sp. WKF15]|uniref:NAD(P)H-quinone oxidoreductase n=1 Tax=Cupriavidus sp. WKF15 TaxID=3032282 RepID=UPI0023E2688C|nr:NAD(P)H-quinone oxidoreductase [Cupriavidus sp. WKF15]WER50352.1 NAD(P)H-quinone oxidoreductase [Cupriavidus sp. WKF15]